MAVLQRFEIVYRDMTADVVEHRLKNGRVFYIAFKQQIPKPLVITVAEDSNGQKFWTSLPEGRQMEAEDVGRLVASYIRSHR